MAQFAGLINLLNLIPVSLGFFNLDGMPAMMAIGLQGRLAVLAGERSAVLHARQLACSWRSAAATAYRMWKRDFPAESKQSIAYAFIALVVANGSLMCSRKTRHERCLVVKVFLLFPEQFGVGAADVVGV